MTRDFFKKLKLDFSDQEEKTLKFIEFNSIRNIHNLKRHHENIFPDLNSNYLTLEEFLKEIKKTYPNIYESIKQSINKDIIFKKNINISEDNDFEKKLYNEYAIFELSEIINNPLFREYINKNTTYKPKI